MTVNRQWLLARRPTDKAVREDFEYRESEIPDASNLAPGHVLIRNQLFLHAPTMRNWMDPASNSFYPTVGIGNPMLATSAGVIVKSNNPRFAEGQRVTAITAWEDYTILNADVWPVRPVADELSLVEAQGPVGMNALTAYMGVVHVGRPKPGDLAVVSGAAGSTGSIAGQILKILGCRTIGIAGSQDKCDRLVSELGFDVAINYKTQDVEKTLREIAPEGVNFFFDNVGGDMLQAVVENIAKFATIVRCGQIAGYNDGVPVPGQRNMMRLIYGSVRAEGFLLGDFEEQIPEGTRQILEWIRSGKMVHREDIRSGFDSLPDTFSDLFTGNNDGTLMVVTDEAARTRP